MAAAFDSFNSTGFDGFVHSGFDARGGGRATLWKVDPANGAILWSYDHGNAFISGSPAQNEVFYNQYKSQNCMIVERGVSVVNNYVIVHKVTSLSSTSYDVIDATTGSLIRSVSLPGPGGIEWRYGSYAFSPYLPNPSFVFHAGYSQQSRAYYSPQSFTSFNITGAFSPFLAMSSVTPATLFISSFPNGPIVLAGAASGQQSRFHTTTLGSTSYSTPSATQFGGIALSPLRSYQQTTMWTLTYTNNQYAYVPLSSAMAIGSSVPVATPGPPQSGKAGNGYYAINLGTTPPTMQINKIGGWSTTVKWNNSASCFFRSTAVLDTSIVEGVDGVFVGGSAPNSLTKLDPATGDVIWTKDFRSDPSESIPAGGTRFIHALCVGADGYLYAGGHRQ